MLPRVLEPEVMDTPEEARDYDAMDHSEVNRRFVEDFLAAVGASGAEIARTDDAGHAATNQGLAEALDLGTGTAQIPIELCRRSSDWRVWAIDLAPNMLYLARANVEVASLSSRIRLDLVDAKRLPYQDDRFAAVISNSIVHHIPEPRFALAEAVRVVRPQGWIFIRDLLRPADDAAVRHLVETYAGQANPHQRKMFDDSLRAALSLDEIRDLVRDLGFSADTVRATSDRHWTWQARNA